MAASGQVVRDDARTHVCTPPTGSVGYLWVCPDCWSEFLYRPVASRELGRVVNLWVRFWEPPNWRWVEPERRGRKRGTR